jgi:hypothetical protein
MAARKRSAKQLDHDIADALATKQVREQFGDKIADQLARSPGRYVTIAWTYDASVVADPGRRYQEASYAKTDVPSLLASLRKHGVRRVLVDFDHEFEI